ncbi:Glycosyltransferase [Arcticibacter svalbardensis MN12-7]|uniref:Glycosyltransferase n=1 Tax=Arcticibacter svalbardensis MN12-7 TaxID=1150600 RepID=R9GQA2_9SPHI|nr:sugar transferase [Arcticibacter svalbardensis]EOR94017.1 Glycosyltransferase [Arcticibacter svalbardensis MN12-7]
MKRAFDFIASSIGLIFLAPIFLIVIILIYIDSKGPPFFRQNRVGLDNRDFKLWKFRSMKIDSSAKGLLTIGNNDTRITKVGSYLRRYKIDELPQLLNVFLGNMSLVGPRPEVRKYVELYDDNQKRVLKLKPGITDMASIKYRDENEILATLEDPELAYITVIMPDKLKINLEFYKETQSVYGSLKVIFLTCYSIIKFR